MKASRRITWALLLISVLSAIALAWKWKQSFEHPVPRLGVELQMPRYRLALISQGGELAIRSASGKSLYKGLEDYDSWGAPGAEGLELQWIDSWDMAKDSRWHWGAFGVNSIEFDKGNQPVSARMIVVPYWFVEAGVILVMFACVRKLKGNKAKSAFPVIYPV